MEALSEQLGSLQIIEEASNNYKQTNTEMSAVPAPALAVISKNVQTRILKNMVPDLE